MSSQNPSEHIRYYRNCRTEIIQFHYASQHFQTADPKKATPAPAAAAEAAQTAKTKEEPKAAAKSSEGAADNKPASAAPQAGDEPASVPKKLEKRNSIHLFFKNLVRRQSLSLQPCLENIVAASPPLDGSRCSLSN